MTEQHLVAGPPVHRRGASPDKRCFADAAAPYVYLGWSVLPLHTPTGGACSCAAHQCSNAGKHPRTSHGVHDASRDSAVIGEWSLRWSGANIGIATGRASGIVVLDVDPRHGGEDSLLGLEATHGKMPATAVVRTGGGGQHYYFRHPGSRVPNSAGRIGDGLDMRGDEGFVVAPPSVHASGRCYAWVGRPGADWAALAPLPEWLLCRVGNGVTRVMPKPARRWGELTREGAVEGRRNTSLAELAGHLLRGSIHPHVARELLWAWNEARCKPPLDWQEFIRVIESIARCELRRRQGRDR